LDSAIRLYFDEGVQTAVAHQIRLRGIDAVHVRDLGLRGDSDFNHLVRASEMGRVICTYDMDFLRLHAQGIPHYGIIIAQHHVATIGDWIHGLEVICGVMSAEAMKNHIEYL
jgi:predicted nuclease of predicted toxin-antitoxin system